nr:glycine zipper 2TM domain-containing protein [uncultured Moellerella sp.]
MLKQVLIGVVAVTTLAGCANTSTLAGDTYSANQAKQVQTVTYGTVLNVRPINIQAGNDENVLGAIGGAVLGGLLGNTIGGGTGKTLTTATGAILGGLAGQGVEGTLNKTKGVQLEIRLDSGKNIVVVQKEDPNTFSVNQRVMIANSGGSVTVSPR